MKNVLVFLNQNKLKLISLNHIVVKTRKLNMQLAELKQQVKQKLKIMWNILKYK